MNTQNAGKSPLSAIAAAGRRSAPALRSHTEIAKNLKNQERALEAMQATNEHLEQKEYKKEQNNSCSIM